MNSASRINTVQTLQRSVSESGTLDTIYLRSKWGEAPIKNSSSDVSQQFPLCNTGKSMAQTAYRT